jgi:hypothetical protein
MGLGFDEKRDGLSLPLKTIEKGEIKLYSPECPARGVCASGIELMGAFCATETWRRASKFRAIF